MTVYTTLPTDDLNLAVEVTESNDMVTLNITPASVNVTSAVTSVNGLTGNVTLTTTEISEGTNEYFTDARADARVDLQTGANLDLSFSDTDDLAEGPTNLYSKQPNATTDDVAYNTVTADFFGVQHFTAKAREAISAGQPVYISGHSGNTPEVMVADFDDPAKMPAFGIASADIANNNNGSISTFGDLKNIDTTGTAESETWAVGDELYVNNSKLTNTRPTGSAEEVQKIAKIIRVHANNGQLFLMGAGRSNDTPNLAHYNVFIGNASGVEKRQLTYTDISATPDLTGTVTPTSTDTFTNKSGNISMWTNDAGYLTSETDSQTLSFSTPDLTISSGNTVDLSALTTGYITASSTDTLTNKSGNISMFTNDSAYLVASALTPYYTSTQVDALPVSTFTNDAGYLTAETDSQTLSFSTPDLTISNGNSVDLTTLTTGFITASSTETLTNKSGNISMFTNDAGYSTPTSTDTFTNKSGNISQWTNDSAYLVASALTPYYTSTQVDALPVSTFSNDSAYITASSTDTLTNKSGNISQWTNDAGYLTAETDNQTLSFSSPNLTISSGNTVDISGLAVATIDGGTY